MAILSFVLWLVLFPLCMERLSYVNAKRRVIEKKEPMTDKQHASFGAFCMIVWFGVAILIYNLI